MGKNRSEEEKMMRFAELLECGLFEGDVAGAYFAAYNTVSGSVEKRINSIMEKSEFVELRREYQIVESLGELTDEVADEELRKLVTQNKDPKAKIAAIKEYNRLRSRVIQRHDIRSEGKELRPIYNVSVEGKIKSLESSRIREN